MSEKVILKLDESNELGFKLTIQGMSTEPNSSTPICRFVVMESGGSQDTMGYMFPVKKQDDGTVIVTIPPMKNIFKENKDYTGKIEILLGSRYFTPATMNIGFEKPVEVTVESVKPQIKKEEFEIFIEPIVINNKTEPVVKTAIHENHESKPIIKDLDELVKTIEESNHQVKSQEKQNYVELTKSQLEELIRRKRSNKLKESKETSSSSSSTDDLKIRMKNILKDSLK